MTDVDWATRIPPGADAWLALPPRTRQAVRRAARHGTAAPDPATALAAVEYGRFLRRRWLRIALVLGVATFAFIGVAGWCTQLPAIAGAVVIASLAGCGMVVALARGGRGVDRLIGANLGLAAGQVTGRVRPEWRSGSRWPRATFTLFLYGWPIGVVALFVWHQTLPCVLALIGYVGTVAHGPSWGGLTRAATMSASGVDLPVWHARIPWTSVGTVDLGPTAHELSIVVDGPFEVTGWQPRRWARRVATALQPGKTVKLTVAHPELGLWTALHHRAAVM